MQIIPVIDLKEGHVIHAIKGNRDDYQPIRSSLCHNAGLENVIDAFLNLYAFETFYIADLDALTGTGNHNDMINNVLSRYSDIMFWVDSGFNVPLRQYARFDNFIPVIGTESLCESDLPQLNDLNGQFILSLDFIQGRPCDAGNLFGHPELWPDTIIVMTLNRVGSGQGPDFITLENYRNQFDDKKIVAAGGIRDKADLLRLKDIGIHSALIASALHAGSLSADEISAIR